MALSTNRFRQGGRGAVTASSMPMTLTPARTTAPYPLSRIMERGDVSHGNASVIRCFLIHCGESMAKRREVQLERHAASEGIAEPRGEETDNRLHAGDALQTRPERPGFLRLIPRVADHDS